MTMVLFLSRDELPTERHGNCSIVDDRVVGLAERRADARQAHAGLGVLGARTFAGFLNAVMLAVLFLIPSQLCRERTPD
jgi:hypothetical protein